MSFRRGSHKVFTHFLHRDRQMSVASTRSERCKSLGYPADASLGLNAGSSALLEVWRTRGDGLRRWRIPWQLLEMIVKEKFEVLRHHATPVS